MRRIRALGALDGHEPDEDGLAVLRRLEPRIELHRRIAEEVLGRLCEDADAANPTYVKAGRIGSVEATQLIRRLVDESPMKRP